MTDTEILPKINNAFEDEELTPIQNFFKNTNIFITGGTGFLGHLLIDKILRDCEISTLYLLIRNKKGKNINSRLDDILDNVFFDRLRKECPKFRHKIVCVAGDCALPDLGLSLEDRKMLIDKVDIIFHAAATVRFDEKLQLAVNINIKATRDILKLAREVSRLKCFMHVSTAFSNCPEPLIQEKIYPPAMDYKQLILLTETVSEKAQDQLTPVLLGKFPNTYALSKQIAEDLVKRYGSGLPIGVFRPSIVVASYQQPVRGWINNLYGPIGLTVGCGLGVVRVSLADLHSKAHLVPGDMCVNGLLAAAWDVGNIYGNLEKPKTSYDIPVYNYDSSVDNAIDWNYFGSGNFRYASATPSIESIWYPFVIITKSYLVYQIMHFLLHIIPSIFIDAISVCLGKKPRLLKVSSKINAYNHLLSYFSCKNWNFEMENWEKLVKKMTDKDRHIFFSDLKKLNWDEYFKYLPEGMRKYIVRESMDTVEKAKRKHKWLYYAHCTVLFINVCLIFGCLWILLGFL